jgi:hypothetical protein
VTKATTTKNATDNPLSTGSLAHNVERVGGVSHGAMRELR